MGDPILSRLNLPWRDDFDILKLWAAVWLAKQPSHILNWVFYLPRITCQLCGLKNVSGFAPE